jgi:hypothetical protein
MGMSWTGEDFIWAAAKIFEGIIKKRYPNVITVGLFVILLLFFRIQKLETFYAMPNNKTFS